jgi:hypothetical protein
MKNYIYSISPEVWQLVCDGVEFLDEDEQPTSDKLQKIYRNNQAISILTSSIDKEEFNHVVDLDVTKDVWITLRMTHERSKPVRKVKVEMLEGQLNQFIMYDDETHHTMFNRLKKLVNKARSLGSKKWVTDRMLTERLMMAYTPMNYIVVALIRQDPAYKKMTSDDVLGRIMNREMNIQEGNIKNLYKGISTSKKQDITLKTTNKSKKKKDIIERPSEEEEEEEDEKEYDEEEMALFIKKFNRYIKKRRPYKGNRKENPRSKRVCYNCGKNSYFIAQCSYERKEEDNDKEKKFDKVYNKDKKYTKKKSYGQAYVGQEWNSSDNSSKLKSDDLTTIAIKGKASSIKSLFPKLSKHTYLMTKKGKIQCFFLYQICN